MRAHLWGIPAVLFVVALLTATLAGAAPLATGEALAERSLGKADAPVTLIEYSSLTCPHCADFHKDVLPELTAGYVDTGKLRYVFRDFPLEPRAMAAAMVARCLDPARYFGFIDMLFRDQAGWAKSKDLLSELRVRAGLAGLAPADVDACLDNRALMEGIRKRAEEGQAQYGIDSTPSFVLNGVKYMGPRGTADLAAAIDAAAKKR